MKHASRIEAERKVIAADRAVKQAEKGTDETAYLAAFNTWRASLADLVSAEIAHPTARESSRRNSRVRLENMGLME